MDPIRRSTNGFCHGHDFGDTHASQSALERVAVDTVSILVQPPWRRVVRKRVDHLLSSPDRRRMSRDVDMHDAPTLVRQDDGFVLHETVAEVMQRLDMTADELKGVGIRKPREMTKETPIALFGGRPLTFDEYGRLKYEAHNDILDAKRQTARIAYLFESGYYDTGVGTQRPFAC